MRTRSRVFATFACLVLTTVVASCSNDIGTGDASPASGSSTSSCPDALDWSDAHGVVGEDVELVGDVISASYRPDVSGEPTFLNIGVDYPDSDRLTVVIWGEDRETFANAPEEEFAGERVCVRGEVSDYKGVTEVEVSHPSQINVD
jgi:hypothetical protein